jgi:hypothetical protein
MTNFETETGLMEPPVAEQFPKKELSEKQRIAMVIEILEWNGIENVNKVSAMKLLSDMNGKSASKKVLIESLNQWPDLEEDIDKDGIAGLFFIAAEQYLKLD